MLTQETPAYFTRTLIHQQSKHNESFRHTQRVLMSIFYTKKNNFEINSPKLNLTCTVSYPHTILISSLLLFFTWSMLNLLLKFAFILRLSFSKVLFCFQHACSNVWVASIILKLKAHKPHCRKLAKDAHSLRDAVMFIPS